MAREQRAREIVAPADVDEVHVPVLEERLRVEKRRREIGEVPFHRRIGEERVTIGVDVARERLRVNRREFEPRPAQPEELQAAFSEHTLRLPVFGEKASARKKAFVTSEVVVHRRNAAELKTVTETLGREEVEVEEAETPFTPTEEEETAVIEVAGVQTAPPEPEEVVEPMDEAETQVLSAPLAPRTPPAPVDGLKRVLDEVRTGWSRARSAGDR